MSRRAPLGIALSLVLALALFGGLPAGGSGGDKGKTPAATESGSVARIRHMRALLDEMIDMKAFQEQPTLKETLTLLVGKVKDAGKELTILVNVDAFREENPDAPDVYDTVVRFPSAPRRMSVGNALRFALSRVPTANATFLVRVGHLEVTTLKEANLKRMLGQRILAAFDRRPLGEALDELWARTGVTVTVDARASEKLKLPVTAAFGNDVTLEAALRMLTDMADLRVVLMDEGVYVTSIANARELERERRGKLDEDGSSPGKGRTRPLREKPGPAPVGLR
ncbi:MAG: hypothetical protein L0Z62_12720 [Gemmataceae bacterium]|nr:hypothetical protein [Gemmataceae bacterium]